jgi:hypothetical protein
MRAAREPVIEVILEFGRTRFRDAERVEAFGACALVQFA